MKRPFELVHVALAAYSTNYEHKVSPYMKLAGSLLTGAKYAMNPEHRAQKVTVILFIK